MQQELITFGISGQRFGIDIMTVREIRAWTPVSRLPRAADHVAGVVNLRGAALPVIDLASRLGWEQTKATPRNPIIVIEHERQPLGLIVHDMSDIISIDTETLHPPATIGAETICFFLEGIAPVGHEMVMVLNCLRLMADEPVEFTV